MGHPMGAIVILALALTMSTCAPRLQDAGTAVRTPELVEREIVLADGARLPLRRWLPESGVNAVVVAVHGFTDYSAAFDRPASRFVEDAVAVYAYDQRGFGGAPHPGLWPGTERLIDDLRQVAMLVHREHPRAPLVLLGESMGAAVVAVAMARQRIEGVSGIVLVAPAVWGASTLDSILSGLLYVSAHTVPWLELSAALVRRHASDNRDMLAALDRDPLVLQTVRVDVLHGLVTLMEDALAVAPALTVPTLVLYGKHERIVPEHAREAFLKRLNAAHSVRTYPADHHTLLRDLSADVVIEDVARWIAAVARRPGPEGSDAGILGSIPRKFRPSCCGPRSRLTRDTPVLRSGQEGFARDYGAITFPVGLLCRLEQLGRASRSQ